MHFSFHFVHSFIHSFLPSIIHSFIHSFIPSFIPSFLHSLIDSVQSSPFRPISFHFVSFYAITFNHSLIHFIHLISSLDFIWSIYSLVNCVSDPFNSSLAHHFEGISGFSSMYVLLSSITSTCILNCTCIYLHPSSSWTPAAQRRTWNMIQTLRCGAVPAFVFGA